MKIHDKEIQFISRLEALAHLPWLRDGGWTLYTCGRCGISFASYAPSTDTGAIICDQCEGEVLKK